jgi:hypothetical protein
VGGGGCGSILHSINLNVLVTVYWPIVLNTGTTCDTLFCYVYCDEMWQLKIQACRLALFCTISVLPMRVGIMIFQVLVY